MAIRVGTAAWTIAKASQSEFPDEGSHLTRYSQVLNGVEINSSFYKDHLPKSYSRWADETPEGFEFAVKLNRRFTHDQRLKIDERDFTEWFETVAHLGTKLGPLLVQMPPSLQLQAPTARRFFSLLRENFDGAIACEPRHPSWIQQEALRLFEDYRITKVEADPDPIPVEPEDLPATGLRYLRLHGSPEIYKSQYSNDFIESLAIDLVSTHSVHEHLDSAWVIFDNTTFGYATEDALNLQSHLGLSSTRDLSVMRASRSSPAKRSGRWV